MKDTYLFFETLKIIYCLSYERFLEITGIEDNALWRERFKETRRDFFTFIISLDLTHQHRLVEWARGSYSYQIATDLVTDNM